MDMELKEAIEQQGKAWQQFRSLDETRYRELTAAVSDLQRAAGRPPFVGDTTENTAAKAFYDAVRTGRESPELKALSAGSDPDGGWTVPPQVDTVLTKYVRDRAVMRQLSRVVQGTTADYVELHSVLGTEATWAGETQSRPTTTSPTFKKVTIPVHEIYANPAITQQLLDDSQFDLEGWLITELGDAFADAENDSFINGDGVAKPRGLFTYTVSTTADATRPHDEFQYTKSGANGAFHTDQADALITLMYSLPPQYRTPGCAWLMSSEVESKIRKMKESTTNAYIWQPGMQEGAPPTLFGWPVYTTDFVPALATGSLSLAFGRFDRAYTIVDRNTRVLRDPYSAKPFVNLYATRRVGGGGARDTRAIRFMKFSA